MAMTPTEPKKSDAGKPTELPPGIDAPTPQAEHDRILAAVELPADVERDIHQLAERVGGLYRLRELVDQMVGVED